MAGPYIHVTLSILEGEKVGLPPNTLGVPRGKRSKKGEKMRNSLIGLENRYSGAYEVGTCCEVLLLFP